MSALRQMSNPARSNPYQSGQPRHRPVSPQRSMRRVALPQQRQQRHAKKHRLLVVESMVKIAVSLVVSTVSIATLAHVIPTRVSQQEKLQELRSEVTMTEQRVAKLRTEFSRSFDSNNVRDIAQEQTHFSDPNRTPVVWLDKKGEVSATLPD